MDETTKTGQEGVSADGTSGETEKENSAYVDKLAPIYHKATTACSKMMEPIHEMNEYVDKKNELDEQYKDNMDSEDYKNAVKELQTGYFGEDAIKLNVANKFESVHDFADSYGITAVGAAVGGVASRIKDAFSKTSAGQALEDIKQAAAEIEETESAEAETESATESKDTESKDTETAKSYDSASSYLTGQRTAQAASYLGVDYPDVSAAKEDVQAEAGA